jgi:hypothetical protein
VFGNLQAPKNGSAVLRDQTGDIYLGGEFFDTLDLGAGPVVTEEPRSRLNPDIVLAQLDPASGKAMWTRSFGSPGVQSVSAIAANGTGQLGVVGELMEGYLTVAGDEVARVRTGDQYILGASALDGAGIWARRVNLQSGVPDARAGLRSIAGAPQGGSFAVCGNVVCGKVAPPVDGGPMPATPAKDLSPTLVCQGGEDVVIAGIDGGSGATLWVEQIGGTNDEDCASVAMDTRENAYAFGTYRFASELRFGALPTLPIIDRTQGTTWAYLAKRSPSAPVDAGASSPGQWLWAQSLGSSNQTITPQAMVALPSGEGSDIVIAAKIAGPSTTILGVDASAQAFVARLDGATGSRKWVQGLGGGSELSVSSISDAGARLQIVGKYYGALSLGPVALPQPHPSGGAFVAQLDAMTGAVLAAKGYGSPSAANSATGVVVRTEAAGAERDTSLVLFSFSVEMALGSPIGVVSGSAADGTNSSCLVKLAP